MESEWGTKAGVQSPQLKHSVPTWVLRQQLSLDVLWHLFVCDFPLMLLRQQQCLDSSHPLHNWQTVRHATSCVLKFRKEAYSHDDCQVLVWTEPSFVISPVEQKPSNCVCMSAWLSVMDDLIFKNLLSFCRLQCVRWAMLPNKLTIWLIERIECASERY